MNAINIELMGTIIRKMEVLPMGIRNYLIEGVSGTGKTSVCNELQRRGYQAIHGDRELAYQGDPETGARIEDVLEFTTYEEQILHIHEQHIWDVEKVKTLVAEQDEAVTFFCGGSRNYSKFIDLFDGVFVLDVDLETLNQRLDERAEDEWGGKGRKSERELIVKLHQSKKDIPNNAIVIDATPPIEHVVDEIVRQVEDKKPNDSKLWV